MERLDADCSSVPRWPSPAHAHPLYSRASRIQRDEDAYVSLPA